MRARIRWMARAASLATTSSVFATDLRISDIELNLDRDAPAASVSCTIAWDNAWRNQKNRDAAWFFLKYRLPGRNWWGHIPLGRPGFEVETLQGPEPHVIVPPGEAGFFLEVSEPYRGDVEWVVEIPIPSDTSERLAGAESADAIEVEVIGLEMVYIPEGPFALGEPSADARAHASFFRSNSAGAPDGLVRIESEGAIEVGPHEGLLYYDLSENMAQYEGDRGGPVPEAFPKGFGAFYMMKYEITQGQYASFLNMIGESPSAMRDNRGGRAILAPDSRATIRLESDGAYLAGVPNRPANYISWDDGCAFADWAGLRPMTELEFTKACRGPEEPIDHQFPWGTDSKDRLARVMGDDFDLVTAGAADERTLSDETRDMHGASHFWVMDLAGSVWERCVTIGHPIGRAFEGTHGDGRINGQGFAINEDWPRGDGEIGGYGYRGGGQYELGHEYTERSFNPHSPIAWRRFGSWAGGPRYIAYGFRCVRTAP